MWNTCQRKNSTGEQGFSNVSYQSRQSKNHQSGLQYALVIDCWGGYGNRTHSLLLALLRLHRRWEAGYERHECRRE